MVKKKAIEFKKFEEGEIFLKWLKSRLIQHNKNVLGAELGPTGSGKSYRDLRKAELWYKYHFKEDFPIENICFGVGNIMKLLSSGKLRRGEVIIFEEAGVNMGSLDFQNKISKMFTYVLQSFRSMNIAIFFNLPYFTMLNKQARTLLHYSFESAGIDFVTKMNQCKPFFHQVNQGSGKLYKKYPIVTVNGKVRQVKRFNFAMPSQYLVDAYEKKKADYINNLTSSFSKEIDKLNGFDEKKISTPRDKEIYAYKRYFLGESIREISDSMGIADSTVGDWVRKVRKFKDSVEKSVNPLEKSGKQGLISETHAPMT